MELNELLKKVVDSIDRRNDRRNEKEFKKLGVVIGKYLNKLIPLLKKYYKDEWIRKIEDFARSLREERFDEDFDLLLRREPYEIYKNK